MRPTDRLKLLEEIGKELQTRYTFVEIDAFIAAMGLSNLYESPNGASKRVYVKDLLRNTSEADLIRVAVELDIDTSSYLKRPGFSGGSYL